MEASPLKKRIDAWLASANCNCDDGVYCSFCEILLDVIDECYTDRKENDNEPNADSASAGGTEGPGQEPVYEEAGAGDDPGAGERVEGEEVSEG